MKSLVLTWQISPPLCSPHQLLLHVWWAAAGQAHPAIHTPILIPEPTQVRIEASAHFSLKYSDIQSHTDPKTHAHMILPIRDAYPR